MRVLFTSTPGLGHLYPLLPLARAAHGCRRRGARRRRRRRPGQRVTDLGFDAVATAEPSARRQSARSGPGWPARPSPTPTSSPACSAGCAPGAAMPATRAAVADFATGPRRQRGRRVRRPDRRRARRRPARHASASPRWGCPTSPTPRWSPTPSTSCGPSSACRPTASVPWKPTAPGSSRRCPRLLWQSPDDVPGGHPWSTGTRTRRARCPCRLPAPRVAVRPPRRSTRLSAASPARCRSRRRRSARCWRVSGQLDADVLFTVGAMDRAALGPVPANVHVESYVPQQVAMACDVVVSHGGCGDDDGGAHPWPADGRGAAVRRPDAQRRRGSRRWAPAWSVDAAGAATELRRPCSRCSPTRRSGSGPAVAAELAALPSAAGDVLAAVRPAGVH